MCMRQLAAPFSSLRLFVLHSYLNDSDVYYFIIVKVEQAHLHTRNNTMDSTLSGHNGTVQFGRIRGWKQILQASNKLVYETLHRYIPTAINLLHVSMVRN